MKIRIRRDDFIFGYRPLDAVADSDSDTQERPAGGLLLQSLRAAGKHGPQLAVEMERLEREKASNCGLSWPLCLSKDVWEAASARGLLNSPVPVYSSSFNDMMSSRSPVVPGTN